MGCCESTTRKDEGLAEELEKAGLAKPEEKPKKDKIDEEPAQRA